MDINFNELQVDKTNEVVEYNDKLHKYWVKNTGQACISVTTLIGQYTVFDAAFWSAYKALESLASEEAFLGIKSDLLDKKSFNLRYLDMTNVNEDDFNERQREVLAEWDAKREESCIRGTKLHKELEMGHLSGETKEIQKLGLGGKFMTNTTNKIEYGSQKVYPEILLSRVSPDGQLRIAGQADLVVVDGTDVHILDYKTSKKIDKKSYYDKKKKKSQMMKYPLNNIEDTNFWHYSLQLSTYAWMIEKMDPRFNIKSLTIIHYDHDGGVSYHECEYLKNDVERMLADYKRKIKHAEFKKSRERILL